MRKIEIDLNKLDKQQLQAFLILEEVAEKQKVESDNKGWMPDNLPEMNVPPKPPKKKDDDKSTDFII